MDLTPELLRTLVKYDPETGLFTWLPRDRPLFVDRRGWSSWNAQNANQPAFCTDQNGYRKSYIFKKPVLAHRAAFAFVQGRWPVEIDHLDGDKANNRIANLREVTRAENMKNLPARKQGSAVPGVRMIPETGRWCARIGSGKNLVRLGNFRRFEDAVAARKQAEIDLGYHPNHGRKPMTHPQAAHSL